MISDRYLLIASLAYLGLPNLLFAAGWLTPLHALIIIAAGLWGLVLLARRFAGPAALPRQDAMPAREKQIGLSIITLVAVLFVAWSGIGGFGYQNSDWVMHNSLLMHLIEEDWPLILASGESGQPPVYYVYYVGYYLPAAIVGKLLGWPSANAALFLWSAAGLVLCILWVLRIAAPRATRGRILLVSAVFLLFSGLDILGWILRYGSLPEAGEHLENWAAYFQYSANTTLLFWVPQHAIAAWILTGVVMHHAVSRISPYGLGLYVAFALLWTPFAVVGVLPFLAAGLIPYLRDRATEDVFSIPNLVLAPVIALTSTAFLASNNFDFPVSWGWEGRKHFAFAYPIFILFEVIVFVVPILWLKGFRKDPPIPVLWLWTSVGILLILPFFVAGVYNDLVMRGSIPALFVLMIFLTREMVRHARGTDRWVKGLLAVFFCAGTFTAFSEIGRAFTAPSILPGQNMQPVVRSLSERPLDLAQRSGNPDSFFFRYLARTPVRQRADANHVDP